MFAASSLVVAVLATYASVAVLSLSASAPSFLGTLPGVTPLVRGLGWSQPSVASVTKFGQKAASGVPSVGVLSDAGVLELGSLTETSAPAALPLTNTSTAPVTYSVKTSGSGLSASFGNHQSSQQVRPKKSAVVYVSSSARYAGPISGALVISAPGLAPQSIRVHGMQAPLAPAAVTATPAKGGAVNVSWDPSGSVSGVAGYIVQRSTDGATWAPVTQEQPATTYSDQTPSDNTYSYRILAVSAGSPGADSTPSPTATAASDSTAPAPPQSVSVPTWINLATESSVPVTVALAADSQPTDMITVTLTGPAGGTVSQTEPAGTGPLTIDVNAQNLSDGPITASATAADSLGNSSQSAPGQAPITKDTVAPGAPGPLPDLPTITNQNESSYTFQVAVGTPSTTTNSIHARFTDASGAIQTGSGSAADGIVHMKDLSSLADGPVMVSVWITDLAGNQSDPVQGSVTKQATPPAAATDFGVAAGPDNPAGVVTPKSAHAVYITATFAQAPTADEEIQVFAHHQTIVDQHGDGQTTSFTFGPFDFSGVDSGPHKLGLMLTDGIGNETWMQTTYTVDTGVQGPTSVGVPAGPNNPAGYVNAATQTAATIVATFAGPTDPADQIALSVGGLTLAPQSGGSDQAVFTADLSSLPDGTLPIDGTITDPSGVTTSFSGTLIKDTQAPLAPYTAFVDGPPPNTITQSGAGCVNVTVLFNQAPDPSDTVTVTLSDENTSVQGSAPAGDGQVHIGCIDASALSTGTIAVNVTVTDAAGNSTSMAGTSATKLACPPS